MNGVKVREGVEGGGRHGPGMEPATRVLDLGCNQTLDPLVRGQIL